MDSREACERRAWRLAVLLTGDRSAAESLVAAALDAQPDLSLLPDARLDRLVILRSREGAWRKSSTSHPRADKANREGWIDKVRAGRRAQQSSVERAHTLQADNTPPSNPPAAIAPPPPPPPPPIPDHSVFHAAAAPAAAALQSLSRQTIEAWILHELDSREIIEVSRAMDCSRSAAARHVEHARAAMRESLGAGHDAALAELRRQADAFDPGPFIERRRAARRARKRRTAIGWILLALLVIVGAALAWWSLA